MIDGREWMQIRREIHNAVQQLFFGFVDSTQVKDANGNDTIGTESIQSLVAGMPTITGRPEMHPYGFYSRALPSTDDNPNIAVVMRQNEDPSALIVIGHRDSQRPKLDDDGDVILYDGNGHLMKLTKADGVTIDAADDPVSVKSKGATHDAGDDDMTIKGKGITMTAGSDGFTADAGSNNATVKGGEVDITGSTKAVIDAPIVNLTANPPDFVALATKVSTELQKIVAAMLTGTCSVGPVTFASPYVPGPVASSKVGCG